MPNEIQVNSSPDFEDFRKPYFDHVLAEFDLVCPDGNAPNAIKEAVAKRNKRCETHWSDIYLVEKFVLSKQKKEVIKARLPGLRQCYRQIVGSDAYEEYLQSGEAASLDGSAEELQTDAEQLLDALHWSYAMAPEWEKLRTKCLKRISLGIGIAVALMGTAAVIAYFLNDRFVAAIILMSLMGALGGFVSVQQRIEKISTGQDPILTMFQLKDGWFAVHLAPLTGALFALVLFLIFDGGLIRGSIFPDVNQIFQLSGEFGKLLVWGFIAGFAERLVPDTLDNLVSKRGDSTSAKGGPVIAKAGKVGVVEEMGKAKAA